MNQFVYGYLAALFTGGVLYMFRAWGRRMDAQNKTADQLDELTTRFNSMHRLVLGGRAYGGDGRMGLNSDVHMLTLRVCALESAEERAVKAQGELKSRVDTHDHILLLLRSEGLPKS